MRNAESSGSYQTPVKSDPVRHGLAWPAFSALKSLTLDPAQLEASSIVALAARDLRARPFALMRSQLLRRLAHNHAKLIGVTSSSPSAGKSFVSINLAAALAKVSDVPVYLVDLDLRRGSIATVLGIDCAGGIADVLTTDAIDLGQVGVRVEGTKLAVFPTRPIDEGSAELLAGDGLTRLTSGLRDPAVQAIVLCDLPPVFAGDDAMITLEHLDGYLLVVDSGKNAAKQVEHAMQLLEPTPCLGTILNRFQGGIGDGYSYSYGYGGEDDRG